MGAHGLAAGLGQLAVVGAEQDPDSLVGVEQLGGVQLRVGAGPEDRLRGLPVHDPQGEAGADLAIGSRYVEGGGSSEWGLARPALSWLANKYIALVAGVPVRDTTSGYRGYRREVLEATDFERIKIRGYVVHGEMAYQAWINGFRLGEVPIHFRNRKRAASKLTLQEITAALVNFALLRFRYGFRPHKRMARTVTQDP